MTRQPWQPERVHSCTRTNDGAYLVITRSGKTAISPTALEEGSTVSIRVDQTCGPRMSRTNVSPAPISTDAAVQSLNAIDRIRGGE